MTKERERFLRLCLGALKAKGFSEDNRYKERLKRELKEVDAQDEHEYFLKLYDSFRSKKVMFPYNEHNLFIVYLLDLASSFDIDKDYAWIQGECPDIDTDYISPVRDYLKRDWAPKTFGQEYVCEIGTYGKMGLKSAMKDMARTHDLPHDEIDPIVGKIEDKWQDDDGNTKDLEWDDALRIYPDFKAYCEAHPDVADAAKKMLARNKTTGVHAGGLIISSVPIDGFVPLEVRMMNKEHPDGVICAAWTEGQNRQDLGPVGLIKFDLLVVNNLMQIALASKLVKERYNLTNICARPGDEDWSDIAYLNDPKLIQMANDGDLRCIFQFDGEGIRKLVKRGGVTSFNDLAAYSAIYRPGCLSMGMDVIYCRRKKGEEPFNIHPLLQKSLGTTYNVLVYQEQIQDILKIVGGIPDMHTEKIRKAISKKKKEQFAKYKDMFIENGQKVLNVNREFVEEMWGLVEAFSEYGFNKSHSYAYCMISCRLLWLKAHYPLEFYAAMLMCEDKEDKFREYKLDAKNHGIEICPVHINKSKENFTIVDGKIYFGFSNIKGIGEAVAKRIVENQPYQSFEDFLERFGTDASVVKALVALGVFDDNYSRLHLRKYAEFYKSHQTKIIQRDKRFQESLVAKQQELEDLLLTEVTRDDPDWAVMAQYNEEASEKWKERFSDTKRQIPYSYKGESRFREKSLYDLLQLAYTKLSNRLGNQAGKKEYDKEYSIGYSNLANVKLKPEEEILLTDELVVNGVKSYPQAESAYYGFQWTHVLETCLDFKGETIDLLIKEGDMNASFEAGPVEAQIREVRKRLSKNNVTFYSIDIEDANCTQMSVTIWNDDFQRFEEHLFKGNLVRMKCRPPSGGFRTLTLLTIPRQFRSKIAKEEDFRVVTLLKPEKPVEEQKSEFKFDDSVLEIL